MARTNSSGFEINTVTAGVEFVTVTGSPVIQSGVVRSGSFALEISSLASATSMYVRTAGTVTLANNFVRFYFRYAVAPSAENRIFVLGPSATVTTTPGVWITLDNSGALALYDEDGKIGSSSSALTVDTWYRIELQVNTQGAGATDIVNALIDGVEFAGSTTRNIANGVNNVFMGGNLNAEAQTTGTWYFDDFATNDDAGSFENSYPGEGSIIHLYPNGAGDNSDWTGTFADIDENPPDDATTFIADNTLDHIQDVTIDDTPADLGASSLIKVVQFAVRYNVSATTSTDPAFVPRIKASSGGTVEEGTAIVAGQSAWATRGAGAGSATILITYDLPGASTTAWAKSDLDQAQIGVRISTGDTDSVQVTALWLLVEYVPAGAPSTTVQDIIGSGIIPFAR